MRRLYVTAIALASLSPCSSIAAPGDLIEARGVTAPAGAQAWRIRYETRDDFGRRTESTGLVVAPRRRGGARDIVAWQHGTIGIVPACSPSAAPDRFTSIPRLNAMIARGYVVVATDYPGLGTPGPHAYLGGRAAAHAVNDGIMAARRLAATGAGNRYALWGHSQGGHASLWAGLSRGELPGMTLTSVVGASPPTELAANITGLGGLQRGILTAFVLQSWSRAYGLPLTSVTDERTAGIIGRATTGCIGQTKTGGDQLVRVLALAARLGSLDLARQPRWGELLARNTPGTDWRGVPLMIVSADADPVVADAPTRAYVDRVRRAGHPVTFVPLQSKDHATTAVQTADAALDFIARGFAAAAPPR